MSGDMYSKPLTWKILLGVYAVSVSVLWVLGMNGETFGFWWLALAWFLSEYGAKGVCEGLRQTLDRELGDG